MRIIFLDFDGVLNSENFYRTRTEEKKAQEYPSCDFDDVAIANLNRICDETGAKVVVSSTWRGGRQTAELQAILEAVGFTGEVIGKTPHGRDGNTLRGNEILAWIREHEELLGCGYHDFHSYVIIDDDSDFLYWQREHLLIVDGYSGLTHNRAYKAVRLFKKFAVLKSTEFQKIETKAQALKLLVKLRSQWINDQKAFSPDSRESLRIHFGIYALDEAINSLQEESIWRYGLHGTDLNLMLTRGELEKECER